MIKGVKKIKLTKITNEQGSVKHMVKLSDEFFSSFGEIYFSEINPGIIKGWNKRIKATRHYAVISGEIKLILYNGKNKQEFIIGNNDYSLIIIPPNVWSSFKCISKEKAIIADFTDFPYNDNDSEKKELSHFKFWDE